MTSLVHNEHGDEVWPTSDFFLTMWMALWCPPDGLYLIDGKPCRIIEQFNHTSYRMRRVGSTRHWKTRKTHRRKK